MPLPVILVGFLKNLICIKPFLSNWGQKAGDKPPEAAAVCIFIEGTDPSCPIGNRIWIREEMLPVAVKGNDCSEGPHIRCSGIEIFHL